MIKYYYMVFLCKEGTPRKPVHLRSAILYKNEKIYLRNGIYHRDDGPAIIGLIASGWYQNGEHHREDGPAVEFKDGHKEWWHHGKLILNKK